MQALHDVVQAGYVRYIGISSCWAWQCEFRIFAAEIDHSLTHPILSSCNDAEYLIRQSAGNNSLLTDT